MRALGAVLLVAGLLGMFWAANMDTSVSVRDVDMPTALRAYGPPDMRVNNLGLMQQKQNYLIGSGIVAVIGAILFAADWLRTQQNQPGHNKPDLEKEDPQTAPHDELNT